MASYTEGESPMMRKALPTTVYIKLRTAMNRTTDKVALYNFNLSTFWRKVETIPRTSQIDKRPVSCPEIIEIVLVILNGFVNFYLTKFYIKLHQVKVW